MAMKSYYAKSTRSRKAGKTKTEQAYMEHLEAMKRDGKILHYWHEPFNIRVAEGVFYNVDFMVAELDETLSLIEVKGCEAVIEQKAIIKAKLVAERFPFRMRMVWPISKKNGGGWKYRNFSDEPEDEFFTFKNPI